MPPDRFIPTRLARVLQASIDEVDEAALMRLVGVTEDTDLDVKAALYERRERDTRNFAVDLAAMANAVGGLLIIGMSEVDGRVSATSRVTFPQDQEEVLRLEQIIASLVFPPPPFVVRQVSGSEDDGDGYFIVGIARSPLAPHAVRVGSDLRFPLRSGRRNRLLTESEVADAYRRRFAEAAAREARVSEVEETGRARVPGTGEAWLAVTVVPTSELSGSMSTERMRQHEDWLRTTQAALAPTSILRRVSLYSTPALRRIDAEDTGIDREPRNAFLQLHLDGSGYAATVIGRPYPRSEIQPAGLHLAVFGLADDAVLCPIDDEQLTVDLLAAVQILASHAISVGGGGDAFVRAMLTPAFHTVIPVPLFLLQTRAMLPDMLANTRLVLQPGASEHSVDLVETSRPSRELLVAVFPLLTDLVADFGRPEPYQIGADGSLRRAFQAGKWPLLGPWAEAHQIPTADATETA